MTVTYQSSEEALPVLLDEVGPPTPTQVAVAKAIGVEFAPALPRLVAAAWLRDGLSDALAMAAPSGQSDKQREWLEDLAHDTNVKVPKTRTRAEVEAWIQHCFLLLRIQAHQKLGLERGDLVRRFEDDDDAIDEVSSIDGKGRVWLRGRGGQRWPDQLEIVARASECDDEAVQARRIAANRRAASVTQMLTVARQQELDPFYPTEQATVKDLERLRDVIDSASDERPIQRYLDAHPQLLASILSGSRRYVRSKVRLGGKYETDYMLAEVDSAGFDWIYVELETPKSPVILKSGEDLHDKARTGVSQIKNWREWIADNLELARRPIAEDGLGLAGIRQRDAGLVLVGRRQSLYADPRNVRRQLREDARIYVRTYDWLIEAIGGSLSSTGLPRGMSYYLSRY